jgi:hypothetical protein
MLWPRLSPERSCVCCRSRRRLGRLRARPASHCNLDRVVFRYQNERRSRLLAASSYCATGIDLFGNPASPVFSPAPGPIRTARNGLSAVGRCGHGRTSRLPRRTLWVRFQSGVQGRGPLGLQYVDSSRRSGQPIAEFFTASRCRLLSGSAHGQSPKTPSILHAIRARSIRRHTRPNTLD